MLKVRKLFLLLSISILFLLGFSVGAYADDSSSITATVSISICGNRIVEGGEVCDNNVLGNLSCNDFGYDSGELRCSISCQEYDVDYCFNSLDVNEVMDIVVEEEVVVEEQVEEVRELLYESDEVVDESLDSSFQSIGSLGLDLGGSMISSNIQSYDINSFVIASDRGTELPP